MSEDAENAALIEEATTAYQKDTTPGSKLSASAPEFKPASQQGSRRRRKTRKHQKKKHSKKTRKHQEP